MMMILNILISAFFFCYRGRGGKFWYFALMAPFIALQIHSIWELVGWLWVLVVMGAFPTNGLLSATHGNKPGRDEGKWFRWMQLGAEAVANDDWFKYGRYYGLLRALPAVPAFFMIGNPFLIALLFHGDIYWLAGRFCGRFRQSRISLYLPFKARQFLFAPVTIAEVLVGGLMGACI